MLLINFDFSDHKPVPYKLLIINLPVVMADILCYPLLRAQNIIMTKANMVTKSQIREMQYTIRRMTGIQKFPKYLSGLRYSLDHSVTHTTGRFLLFEYLLRKSQQISQKTIYASVLASTLITTLISQPSFNYRLLASAADVDVIGTTERVKQKLIKIDKTKILTTGLRYSLLINGIACFSELFLFMQIKKKLKDRSLSDIVPAFLTNISLALFLHPVHFIRTIRAIEVFEDKQPQRINISQIYRGIVGSIFRKGIYNTLLFGIYSVYFHNLERNRIESMYQKRQLHQSTAKYRQGSPQKQYGQEKPR